MIFAHEMPKTLSMLPCKPLPDFLTKGVGCETFQEEEIVTPFNEHNLPKNVFLAGTHPHPFNPSAVRHWSQNACPPQAYSRMKVHGRVNLTLFFITPPTLPKAVGAMCKAGREISVGQRVLLVHSEWSICAINVPMANCTLYGRRSTLARVWGPSIRL